MPTATDGDCTVRTGLDLTQNPESDVEVHQLESTSTSTRGTRVLRSALPLPIPATRANELALGVFGLVNGTAGTDGCRQSVGMDDEPLRTAQHAST
jgi:hypothetical protein